MINRHVIRGISVVLAPDIFRQLIDRIRLKMFVSFEHHVLKEMRETAPIFRIVLRSDVIPNLDRDVRAGMIFHRINLQSVRQSLVLEIQRRNRDRRFRGSGAAA